MYLVFISVCPNNWPPGGHFDVALGTERVMLLRMIRITRVQEMQLNTEKCCGKSSYVMVCLSNIVSCIRTWNTMMNRSFQNGHNGFGESRPRVQFKCMNIYMRVCVLHHHTQSSVMAM